MPLLLDFLMMWLVDFCQTVLCYFGKICLPYHAMKIRLDIQPMWSYTGVRLGHIKNAFVGVFTIKCIQHPRVHSSYDLVIAVYITQTRPYNILQYFTAVKTIIFR